MKIGSLGLRGGAISALAVDQVLLGGLETRIRARPLERVRISHDSRSGLAEAPRSGKNYKKRSFFCKYFLLI